MKNSTINRIKELTIASLLVAVTFIGFIAFTSTNAYAIDETVGDYILDHKADPNAPDVRINAVSAATVGLSGRVGQYDIKPGKYYIVLIPPKGRTPVFTNYKLVKVVRAYEKSTWYGSERTIDVIYCASGNKGSLQPNKGLKPPHFYSIDKYVVK